MPEDHAKTARIGAEDQNPEHPQAAPEPTAVERELDHAELDMIAHLAGHDPSPSRRAAAFQRLCPCITNIARGIRQRFRNAAAVRELVEDAPRVIWEKISAYEQQRGPFAPWCKTVLYNAAISLVRGKRAEPISFPYQDADRDSSPTDDDVQTSRSRSMPNARATKAIRRTSEDDVQQLRARLMEQRHELDRIRWEPRDTARNVDYFAVLLVYLRLSLARMVAGTIEHQERSAFIAWCLPWHKAEESLAFKAAWPTLLAIWEAFRAPLGQPPNRLDVSHACSLINELLILSGGEASLSADVWNAWAKRAKAQARGRVNDQEVWEELFGWLLEDRVRTDRHERPSEGQPGHA